ncbi:MAG: hypothetical protein KAG28_03890 [Cocleimonas sp.]|nr:hypothetical protein [Cocleimonas sp.]
MLIKGLITISLGALLFSGAVVADTAESEPLISYTKELKHKRQGGGKSTDKIALIPLDVSKGHCALFEKAEVKYTKRRYGKAKIVSRPERHCNPKTETCKVKISWQHSPTGRLNYKVKVTWSVGHC